MIEKKIIIKKNEKQKKYENLLHFFGKKKLFVNIKKTFFTSIRGNHYY